MQLIDQPDLDPLVVAADMVAVGVMVEVGAIAGMMVVLTILHFKKFWMASLCSFNCGYV